MFCKNCGQKINENMKFCHNCGARVENAETPAPARKTSNPAPAKNTGNHKTDKKNKPAKKTTPARKPNRTPLIIACAIGMVVLGIAIGLLTNLNNSKLSSKNKKDQIDLAIEEPITFDPSEAILSAEDTFVTEENYQSFPFTMRCREDVPVDQLRVLDEEGNAYKLKTSSEPTATVSISGCNYSDYEASVDLGDFWKTDAITCKLTAFSGENAISSFSVNKNYEITEEMIDRLTDVMKDLDDYIDTLYETDKKGNTIVKDPEKLVDQVEEWLENNDNVLLYHRADAQSIYYVTVDGLASGYVLNPVNEDPNLNCAGSGVPSDEKTIKKKYFAYDNSTTASFIDPDVLLMCPVREALDDRDGDGTEKSAKALADAYKGNFQLLTDKGEEKSTSSSVMDAITNKEWTEYGTVMLVTHGNPVVRDSDGTSYVNFLIAESKTRENTDRKFRNYLNTLRNKYFLLADTYKISSNMDGWEDASKSKAYAAMPNVNLLYIRQDNYFAGIKNNVLNTASYTICITTNFLRAIYNNSTFPHTLFYLGACHSFEDTGFLEFLTQHGASAIIGYDGQINVTAEESISKHLLKHMLEENEETLNNTTVRNYNITEAFDKGIPFIMDELAKVSKGYGELVGQHSASGPSVAGNASFVYEGYGDLSGHVMDEDGNAVKDATILVYRYFNKKLQKVNISATSDDAGNFTMPHVPYGMLVLQCYNEDDEAFINTSLLDSEKKNLSFTLRTGKEVTIKGRVVDADSKESISNALVKIDDTEKHTDSDGKFKIVLEKGIDYTLSVSADGYKGTKGTLSISEDIKEKSQTLSDIELDKIEEEEEPEPEEILPADPQPGQSDNAEDAAIKNFIASTIVGTWQTDGGMPVPDRYVFYMDRVELFGTSDGVNYFPVASHPYECLETDYGYYIRILTDSGSYGYQYEMAWPEALTCIGNGDPYSNAGYSGSSSLSKIG